MGLRRRATAAIMTTTAPCRRHEVKLLEVSRVPKVLHGAGAYGPIIVGWVC